MRQANLLTFSAVGLLIASPNVNANASKNRESEHYRSAGEHQLGEAYALIAWQAEECRHQWKDAVEYLFDTYSVPTSDQLERAQALRNRGLDLEGYILNVQIAFLDRHTDRLTEALQSCEFGYNECQRPFLEADAHYWPEIQRTIDADMSNIRYDPLDDEVCLDIENSMEEIWESEFVRDNLTE